MRRLDDDSVSKCLLCKREDLSAEPRKSQAWQEWHPASVTPAQVDPTSSLVRESSQNREILSLEIR